MTGNPDVRARGATTAAGAPPVCGTAGRGAAPDAACSQAVSSPVADEVADPATVNSAASDGATSAVPPSDGPAPTVLHEPLPDAVRARLVALAAVALGDLSPDAVPASVRPFRRFTAAKRIRHAATPLAAALESDAAFRHRVGARLRAELPELTETLEAGALPAAADPLDVAAAAYVLRFPGWDEVAEAAVRDVRRSAEAASTVETAATVVRLREEMAQTRTAARADAEKWRAELRAAKEEITGLRHKLRDARDTARTATSAAAQAEAAATQQRAAASAAVSGVEAENRRLRSKLSEVEAALEAARRSVRAGRSLDDARLRLLVDTVVDAAQGLRRELALPPTDVRPADAVSARRPSSTALDAVAERARGGDASAELDQLLALPQVHLVVDGYNVTMTGYGALPLEAQRQRLLTGLAALAARCGAEVTVCFDGAALDGPVVVAAPRGVRILFSEPGETADELIGRLVANEPAGRPVVVVSSDREVADGARASGARALPSAMLLRRLERG